MLIESIKIKQLSKERQTGANLRHAQASDSSKNRSKKLGAYRMKVLESVIERYGLKDRGMGGESQRASSAN